MLLKVIIYDYLNLNRVEFGKYTIIIAYTIISSLNAKLYKTEEILSSLKSLPDIVNVCETLLTRLRPFVGMELYIKYMIKSVFDQLDEDDLLINFKVRNSKSVIVSNAWLPQIKLKQIS